MAISIRLNNVRLSYEHIFKASAFDDTQKAKFSAELIIPKDHPDLATLRRALMDAGRERFPSAFTSTNWPTGFTCALKDCDKVTDANGVLLAEKNEAYKGCFIVKADSINRPVTVNRDRRPVTEEDGVISLSLNVSKERDLRDDIFFAMAEHRIPVLTMDVEELDLEDIFLTLTDGEQSEEAEEESDDDSDPSEENEKEEHDA